jgi:galactonate dehydratase
MGAIEHFKPQLIGQDAGRIEHLWQTLFRGGFFPANRVLCSAISAIDIALWDILGKRLGVPIYQLLGGRARDKVVCYPHTQAPGEGSNIQALVDNARQHVDEGWKFVRWGLPQDGDVLEPREAVKRLNSEAVYSSWATTSAVPRYPYPPERPIRDYVERRAVPPFLHGRRVAL